MESFKSTDVLGVVVLFYPDQDLISRIYNIASQIDALIIYDNTDNALEAKKNEQAINDLHMNNIVYHSSGVNVGIGAALNYALNVAKSINSTYFFTFDQDTSIQPGFVSSMCQAISQPQVAVVGPVYLDANSGKESVFPVRKYKWLISRQKVSDATHLVDVYCCITSGSVYRLDLLRDVGLFRDDYFIDYIDNEYCLRLLKFGYRVCINPNQKIIHALGERKNIKKLITATPTNYSPLRKYYMTRNRIDVYKNYIFTYPQFVLYDLTAFFLDLLRVIFFEKNRKLKLMSILKGVRDGILNKMGKFTF